MLLLIVVDDSRWDEQRGEGSVFKGIAIDSYNPPVIIGYNHH